MYLKNLYNLQTSLPVRIMVNYKRGGNIYLEKEANELEKVISQVNNIFSIIVSNSNKKIENIGKDENKIGINIFVKKDGQEISLGLESTGIIKLVSMLSVMIYFVQNPGVIVAIGEFDIHIFKYLLAILLEKLSIYFYSS